MEKPVSYKGKKPFVFISYSHRDSDRVWPVISKMVNDGYHVWYDEGIEPGKEWDEFIANQITGSGYFIAFISANYIASDNCKDELNFARDRVDNKLLVYLEDASLPSGMEMRLGRIQAIQKFTIDNDDKFYEKLYSSSNLEFFKEGNEAGYVKGASSSFKDDFDEPAVAKSATNSAKKPALGVKEIIILAVAVLLSIAAIIMMINYIDEFVFFNGKYNGTSRAVKALVIAIIDLIVVVAAALTCVKMVFKK